MTSFFGKAPAPPPTPTAPPPLPDPQSSDVLAAKNNAIASALARGGRSSTVLTNRETRSAPTIAAGSYGGKQLGAT